MDYRACQAELMLKCQQPYKPDWLNDIMMQPGAPFTNLNQLEILVNSARESHGLPLLPLSANPPYAIVPVELLYPNLDNMDFNRVTQQDFMGLVRAYACNPFRITPIQVSPDFLHGQLRLVVTDGNVRLLAIQHAINTGVAIPAIAVFPQHYQP